jgi:hypothetical protein
VCSETSAYKIQTPGNYPEENITKFWLVNLKGRYYLEGQGMSRSAVVKWIIGNWE